MAVVEAEAAVIAGDAVTVDRDHQRRENEVSSVTIEDLGALSATGVLHPHRKGGSIVQHQRKEAHKREAALLQGNADRPMVQITVVVQEEGAEPPIVKLMLRAGLTGALQRKTATAAALAHCLGMTGAPFTMMMIIMLLLGAVNQIRLWWFE